MSEIDIISFEARLGYIFKNPALLVEALTHKSYHHEKKHKATSHNERLEFLGDSVLGLVIAEYLFRLKEGHSEATMSKLKSHVVKESVLSDVATELGLGGFIMVGKGEESSGGRSKKSIVADTLEAVIGAVYLDRGFETAKSLVVRLFEDRVLSSIDSGDFYDYKTMLQELTQEKDATLPEYRIVSEEGLEHSKTFTSEAIIGGVRLGIGTGKSKKEAEVRAAKEAVERLREDKR